MLKINLRATLQALIFAAAIVIISGAYSSAHAATTRDELNTDAQQSLAMLTKNNPKAAELASKAQAVLVFPSIVKAGLVFGGAYGEGVLYEGGKVAGYYNSVTASWGFQVGAQSYGYVVFLMNDKAVKYVHDTHGWEVGVGPTMVLVDDGVSKNLSTSTLKDDAYAFAFDQKGLMGSLSLEGTKITRLKE